jgi:putative transposase
MSKTCLQYDALKIVTDKLISYGVAHRELMPDVIHDTARHANNRAEQSHESTRVRERGIRRINSSNQAQRFLGAHAAVYNLFSLGRHRVGAEHYRNLRISALNEVEHAALVDRRSRRATIVDTGIPDCSGR